MENRKLILNATKGGLTIYEDLLLEWYSTMKPFGYVDTTIGPFPNPFQGDTLTLWIDPGNGSARHYDDGDPDFKGDVFDFASWHFDLKGEKLLDKLVSRFCDAPAFPSVPRNILSIEQNIPSLSFFQAPITNLSPQRDLSLPEVAERIAGDVYKHAIQQIRSAKTKKERSQIKKTELDYITFAGTFSKRADRSLLEYSNLMCFDLDDLENPDDTKEKLKEIPGITTLLIFTSPSGNGLKWVVHHEGSVEDYGEYFGQVSGYLRDQLDITVDSSGSNLSRACFMSHDPNLYINHLALQSR